ncbi:hypothetical protein EG832_15330 [bacterium]|nr:hypothetical protein [bacterium]
MKASGHGANGIRRIHIAVKFFNAVKPRFVRHQKDSRLAYVGIFPSGEVRCLLEKVAQGYLVRFESMQVLAYESYLAFGWKVRVVRAENVF